MSATAPRPAASAPGAGGSAISAADDTLTIYERSQPGRRAFVAPVLDAAYRWFAANRLHLTGRCTNGSCKVPHRS